MKAVRYREYGAPEVLKIEELEAPIAEAGHVLIRMKAVSVNFGDLIARRFGKVRPAEFTMPWLFWLLARLTFGWRKPRTQVLGNSFAGEIAAVGSGVNQFHTHDAVFAYTEESMGGYAEYVSMPASGMIATKPVNMSFEEASAVPYGALTALTLLRKAHLGPGQRVLVIGASGSIGSAAVQLARHYFGAHVTAVCGTNSVEYVKRLGADEVIDRQQRDHDSARGSYDLVFDVLGKEDFARMKPLLADQGVYFSVSFKMKKILEMTWSGAFGGQRVRCALARPAPTDLELLRGLIEEGKFTSIIDKTYPLHQAAAAHRYAESGSKRGHIVLIV